MVVGVWGYRRFKGSNNNSLPIIIPPFLTFLPIKMRAPKHSCEQDICHGRNGWVLKMANNLYINLHGFFRRASPRSQIRHSRTFL